MRSLGQCQGVSFCSSWQYISFQMIFAIRKNNMQIQAPLPFISPSPLLSATTLLFLLLIPPLLNADEPWHSSFTLSLLLGGDNCIFPIQSVIGGWRGLSVLAFPIAGRGAGPGAQARQRSNRKKAGAIHACCTAPEHHYMPCAWVHAPA